MTLAPYALDVLAEDAVLLRFGDAVDIELNARVQAATGRLQRAFPALECVPAYASVMLRFDPQVWLDIGAPNPHRRLSDAVASALSAPAEDQAITREHVIPVCYGGAFGQDLDEVASHGGMTTDQVVSRHTAASYRVAMIGFAPGFPYLLGLDPLLAMPRRRDPRQRVPSGSVAIGGTQTGIYPSELPGGWQLIGRTPRRLFDVGGDQPALLMPGDRVRFRAIDEATFAQFRIEQNP